MAQVGAARLRHAVEIVIDHVVEHAHGRVDGFFQFASVQRAVFDVRSQIDRAEVADGDLVIRRVQRDFGAQVGTVNDADMLLRRTQVAWVLEGDPRMAGFEQHRQHFAP